jgi:plasmid stabilization system protein ParE
VKVLITAAAKVDLIEIRDFIRPHNPERATSFVQELLDACQALGDAPLGFPLVPRYERSGIRRKVHKDYLIFYRVSGGWVEVIHVLHGARDYEALLFP